MLRYTLIIRRLWIFALVLSHSDTVWAQKWTFFKQNDGLGCSFFATDPLHNIYIATQKNEILKYDNQGRFESRYANKKYGLLGQIKATNPFKILTYYPDYQVAIIMDAMVNPIATVHLNDLGIAQTAGITMSDDGYIWVVDNGTKQLIKISFNQNGARVEQNIQLIFNDLDIVDILAKDNRILIYTKNKGLLEFNRFGQFVKNLAIKEIDYFQTIGNLLFYRQNGLTHVLDLVSQQERIFKLPDDTEATAPLAIEKGRLFVLKNSTILVYQEE